MTSVSKMLSDYQSQAPLPSTKGANKEELKKAAQEFEKSFISQMFQKLFELNEIKDKSHGEEMFESIKVDIFAEQVCKKETFGLAKYIYKDLCKQNGVALSDVELSTEFNQGALYA